MSCERDTANGLRDGITRPADSVSAFADQRRGVTLAELVRTAALDLATGFPDEIVVVLGGEVAATAAVADLPKHLMPSALSVLALGQREDLRHPDPLTPILPPWASAGKDRACGALSTRTCWSTRAPCRPARLVCWRSRGGGCGTSSSPSAGSRHARGTSTTDRAPAGTGCTTSRCAR